ncbi:MAG: TonB-dependent receptor plug domain-containing protein, partial [Bacteroidia bacterium]|nr:TonB-dependent receptor plug domain-containing protein [Bacteroidia bacterium]
MAVKYLSALILFFLVNSLIAQDLAIVSGTITDEAGKGVELVNVIIEEDQNFGSYSDNNGFYSIKMPAGKSYTIVFSVVGYDLKRQKIKLNKNEDRILNITLKGKVEELEPVIIEDKSEREEISTVEIKLQDGTLPNISGNLESYLAFQALGVQKTNELSSSYSVRGGNYDENLVYVNDFEVYRPFLIRSGQQEGLSFANPDMVSNIKFSSGGFQPEYGDKLSSVLDISYRKPREFGGSASISLLGATGHLEGASFKKNLKYILGIRYKNSRYALNSLNTKGEYNPAFLDFQSFVTYTFSDKLELEWISNYARNRYRFEPENRVTTFGVVNAVLKLNLFFDGQEFDSYESLMSGLSLNHRVNDKLQLKWLVSAYRTEEFERFDIQGQYFLGEVETDFSEEDFGEIVFGLGVGTLHD